VAVRAEAGVNDPLRLTLPLKYPVDVTVTKMFVDELCTKVTWLAVLERLKSRGNSTIVNATGCAAICVRPVLLVPVMVMGYVPAGVFSFVKILIIVLNVGFPIGSVKE